MKNISPILKYIQKKGLEFPLTKDDLASFIFDEEIIRITSKYYPIAKRHKLIRTADMGAVERYIYSSYFNHYSRLKKNKAENKPTKQLLSRHIKNNIKLYRKNYRFPIGFNKLIKKLKNKAYYDVLGKKSS